MTAIDKRFLGGFVAAFFGILIALAFVRCGYDDPEYAIVYEDVEEVPVAFTDEKIRKDCFSAACHNDSAPNIPDVGDGFKASKKVRSRIENGTMPPGNKWSKKDVESALDYLNAN